MTLDTLRDAYRVRPGYWFAPKLFGLGATPVTWQGWAMLAGFIAVVVGLVQWVSDDTAKLIAIIAVTLPFTLVAWMKTDGGWRWHWGWRR